MSISVPPNMKLRKPIYRAKDLRDRTGLANSTVYRDIKTGEFPPGRLIAENIRVWTEEEIEEEMQRRFALHNESAA